MTRPTTHAAGTVAVAARPTPGRGAATLLLGLLTTALLLVAGLAHAGPAAAKGASGATPPGAAWVRAGHFVPGFGAARVDLVPQGAATGTPSSVVMSPGATYGDVTDYQKVAPGAYTVQVRSSGAQPSSAPLLSRSFTVTAGTARTIAVVGDASAPRLVVLDDDLTPPAAGSARVRVLDASATAGGLSIQAVDGPTIATGTVLGQVTAYATVPQGSWTLGLTAAAGTTAQQKVTLSSGSVYTAVALDDAGSVSVKVVTDAAGSAALPAGGAATGMGGLAGASAASDTTPVTPLALVAALALALSATGVLVAGRRRRTAPVR